MELFDLIQTLVGAHGPSGDEGEIRETISRLAAPFADEITTDAMGNLIVHKKGSGPRVMFAAHMDSIGLIVTHVEKEGLLRVGKLGGVDPREVVYAPVRFRNGVRGLVAKDEKAEFGKLKWDDCYLDIGAKDLDQAKTMVQVGDTAVYATLTVRQGEAVLSPYLDDRVACAVLLSALEQLGESPNDLYFVFTVQEEVGLRGARASAWSVDPDYGIVVDVTYSNDTPGGERTGTSKLGEGAAIKLMDSSVICHREVVAKLEELARAGQIPAQRDIISDGGTDGGPIHTTRAGVRTGGISIPCRYMHTPTEMVSLSDVAACVRLVCAFASAQLER